MLYRTLWEICKIIFHLELLAQLEPYLDGMVLRLVPFIIMLDDPTRHQRWPSQPQLVLQRTLLEIHENIYKSGNYLFNWTQTLVE